MPTASAGADGNDDDHDEHRDDGAGNQRPRPLEHADERRVVEGGEGVSEAGYDDEDNDDDDGDDDDEDDDDDDGDDDGDDDDDIDG